MPTMMLAPRLKLTSRSITSRLPLSRRVAPAFRAFHATSLCPVIKPFKLADIGEGITEVEIVKWLVEADQVVDEFDPIIEVMSDKATVEITSPFKGKITNLSGAVGDVIRVGGVLCEVDMAPEEGEVAPPAPPSASPSEPVSEASSNNEKATPSVTAPPRPATTSSGVGLKADVLATPATRRLAREASISLNDVPGTGKDGRVTKGDVMDYVASLSASPTNSATSSAPPPQPSSSGTTIIPLTSVRKAMFKAMTASLQMPHFAYSETLDVTLLERLRQQLNAAVPLHYRKTLTPAQSAALSSLEAWGGSEGSRISEEGRFDRITLFPLLVKSLSLALEQHPLFRSSLAPSGDSLLLRPDHDISIALSSPTGGLYTPLLPSVNRSSPFQLASQIVALQAAVPKFPVANRGSGTITLSNVGVVGGTTTHPVIPPTGQLAIGALGRTRVVPMYVGEDLEKAKAAAVSGKGDDALRMEPRLVMDVSFSADHRVVEGVELAQLVETWKRIVESPGRLSG